MKRLIFKTAIITLIAACVAFLSLFGILSLAAPVTMMNLTASIGLNGMSADYAYDAYGREDDPDYLARSAEVCYSIKSYKKADERFEELIARKDFFDYCKSRDDSAGSYEDSHTAGSYDQYVYSLAACAKYRVAETEEEQEAVIAFAIGHTDESFPAYNPVISLAVEARGEADRDFCTRLVAAMEAASFDAYNADFNNVIKFLEDFE